MSTGMFPKGKSPLDQLLTGCGACAWYGEKWLIAHARQRSNAYNHVGKKVQLNHAMINDAHRAFEELRSHIFRKHTP